MHLGHCHVLNVLGSVSDAAGGARGEGAAIQVAAQSVGCLAASIESVGCSARHPLWYMLAHLEQNSILVFWALAFNAAFTACCACFASALVS